MKGTLMKKIITSAVVVLVWAAVSGPSYGQDVYKEFNAFCIKHFGAEKEPLVYTRFGKELKMLDDGLWKYVSETSTCIGFETSLPAKAYVEYGETQRYGSKTSEHERHFYLHLHYLRDLKPDTTYHYRLVATDERGNKVTSGDMSLTTKTPANVIRIPGDVDGPPYVLDKAGTTYLVTKDLVIDGAAFEVKAPRVTLDLGGHTVIYNNRKADEAKGLCAVQATKMSGTRIFNGTIKQGAGNDGGQRLNTSVMYFRGGRDREIAGVTLQYSGPQKIGICNHWEGSGSEIHHNVFLDTGTKILNRHGAGCRALIFAGSKLEGVKTHHNLVKRTRQSGLQGQEVHNNEVYVDSWATNSFAVYLAPNDGKMHDNRIFGTGYHVCASSVYPSGIKQRYYRNFIHMEGQEPRERSSEYGQHCSLNGFRITQYSRGNRPFHDIVYYENTIVVAGSGGSQCRGVQFTTHPNVKNVVFRNNTIKAMVRDKRTKQAACVVTHGRRKDLDQMPPVVYKDNTFISNICHVRFGDGYSIGCKHHLYDNRFVKVGSDPRYRMFNWPRGDFDTRSHVIRDAVLEGGASLDSMNPFGGGQRDFTVQWTLTVKTTPGADVTITDKDGNEVFSGKADAAGVVKAPLSQYLVNAQGKTFFTPHAFKVEKAGGHTEKTVTMDRKRTLAM